MVIQNKLPSMKERKKNQRKKRFAIAIDLIKCLKQIK